MAAEYLLTSSLAPIERGQGFEGSLPLHVTVQQWFSLERERAFINALQNLATRFEPFEIEGGDEALYGPHNDVQVRLVRKVGRLARLHLQTGELVARFGGELRNPEWAGDRYSPHVTRVEGAELKEGEVVTIRTIELIKRAPGERLKTVESVLPLSRKS